MNKPITIHNGQVSAEALQAGIFQEQRFLFLIDGEKHTAINKIFYAGGKYVVNCWLYRGSPDDHRLKRLRKLFDIEFTTVAKARQCFSRHPAATLRRAAAAG